LGLHADEVLDRLFGGEPLAAQQHLPLQRGAVERRGERIGTSVIVTAASSKTFERCRRSP
jgi:hypothetical protein